MKLTSLCLILSILHFTKQLYFDLFKDKETCFEDTLTRGSILIIQYKTLKVTDNNTYNKEGYYLFNLKDPLTERLIDVLIGDYIYEGKVYFQVRTTDRYLICAIANINTITSIEKSLKFNLIIATTEEYKSIKINESEIADASFFDQARNKIESLYDTTSIIQEFQNKDLENEEDFTNFQKNNNQLLLYIILAQIILILIIIIYSSCLLSTQIKKIVN